jgi:5-methylcytosine-specific restriction endonuclease McrA
MPIKPENKHLYPKNWKQIRKSILERANNHCEFCGVENYAEGYRDSEGKFVESYGMQQEADALDGEKIIKIVLTIAHLDHNPQNCYPENLRALCQKCHLNYDIEHHKETRRNSKKLPLFDKGKVDA